MPRLRNCNIMPLFVPPSVICKCYFLSSPIFLTVVSARSLYKLCHYFLRWLLIPESVNWCSLPPRHPLPPSPYFIFFKTGWLLSRRFGRMWGERRGVELQIKEALAVKTLKFLPEYQTLSVDRDGLSLTKDQRS
jgi:hypothetical protein